MLPRVWKWRDLCVPVQKCSAPRGFPTKIGLLVSFLSSAGIRFIPFLPTFYWYNYLLKRIVSLLWRFERLCKYPRPERIQCLDFFDPVTVLHLIIIQPN